MNISDLMRWVAWGPDPYFNRGPNTGRWRLTTHEVTGADGTVETRPILKPRDRSKYSPRRNTPRAQRGIS